MGKKLPYKYNLKKGKIKKGDLLFHEHVKKNVIIPQSADLREGYGSIKDQGQLGACTSFSACSVLEYLLNKDVSLSELYFYFQERKEDGDIKEDSGSSISCSAEVAAAIGTCTEILDPYDISKFTVPPTPEMDADAKKHKAVKKYAVTTIDDILYSVGVLKKPVLIGIDVYESFENIGSDGYIPMPRKGEELLGGHALNVCGYFHKDKSIFAQFEGEFEKIFTKTRYKGLYFIVRNSWGTSFGDKGYIYMPAQFLLKYSSDWWYIDLK
ncbi:C1 family peptidase [Clostridium sp. Mt-5]|uniref:C1 family peptidase n=1 Tax=Clostridium moutaii TaxID=3240932 RepID=A0ABV4BT49_9CLOT